MQNKRLFDELMKIAQPHDYNYILQRAENAIANCNYVMDLIEEQLDEETAKELCNRLLLSVKNRDNAKFTRKMNELIKNRKKSK
ncbi:virion structural protein [Agrobacterium phage Atu_ph07]|uniref:Uncharacterized protein n=1 Tax=Agrobacterium phage Atu_ph07 TaxID=2024264 RepID=A0A2L0UZD4_9CAUD|nr:virion structural protein [Agrobacterium phage Atu_ph07]AUZ94880.1 hypothetical protein [Agrobacterium phage Atu_ph07]